MQATKKPWLAFVFSLVLPGAGLCYLDRWGWGLANFLIVQAVLLAVVLLPLGSQVYESFHYVLLILAAGSAGLAHSLAGGRVVGAAAGQRAGGRGDRIER